jgi:hypothetical protein
MEWLLDSDPAIHWQALRDLAEAPPELIAAERARVATDGWGVRLLDLQGGDGQWEGGALFPARWFETPLRARGRRWPAEPVEHAAGAAGPALVRRLTLTPVGPRAMVLRPARERRPLGRRRERR